MEYVISLDITDLPKLCDVVFKDAHFTICPLNYLKPEWSQLTTTTKSSNNFFDIFLLCLASLGEAAWSFSAIFAGNIASVRTFLV